MIDLVSLKRKFLPADFKLSSWELLFPFTQDILSRQINSLEDFKKFMEDYNEISTIVWDEEAIRYINCSRYTKDAEITAFYDAFVESIEPQYLLFQNEISKKIVAEPFAKQLKWPGFSLFFTRLKNSIKIFREENVSLSTQVGLKKTAVNAVRGSMAVTLDGEKMTLGQASDRLFWNDREKRKEAYLSVGDRLFQDKDVLDQLFDEMFTLRQQQAKNAGFKNYRDFCFAELNRTDYTAEQCYEFHQSVKESVVPLLKTMHAARKQLLGYDTLYPWDLEVDPLNRKPLSAFANESDFIEKAQAMFDAVDPVVGDTFRLMNEKQQMDLVSRDGKQSGAYCYGSQETSIPFVFQNATEKVDDVSTLAHEVGHAVHHALMNCIPMTAFRNFPFELAELASMSMELFSMDHWGLFFQDKEDLFRAQREHLENIIAFTPWICLIDEFQHKLYLQENPTIEKRHELWAQIISEYKTGEVETDSHIYDNPGRTNWLKQNHVFVSPFYYIDYNIAQLGALEIWRNFKKNPEKALEQYKSALKLGYTQSMPSIYHVAGASFDFSSKNIKELMQFVGEEIEKIRQQEMHERD